jgi:hypothetical protein
MRLRASVWLSWAACGIALVLTALSLPLLYLNATQPGGKVFGHWLEGTILAIGFSVVGAIIVPRCPSGNPIGWLFCATGLLWALVHFCAEYALYGLLTAPGSLWGGEAAAWLFTWFWVPELGITAVSGLFYPDGRLPGSRWRWLLWLYLLLTAVGATLSALDPGLISVDFPVRNPLGVGGMPNAYSTLEALMLTAIFVSAISLLLRLRRARGVERQQIKWYAYAVTVATTGGILTYPVAGTIGAEWLRWAGYTLLVLGVVAIPVAMGLAITRYRLYDIDIIIHRTLLYGALTASLVALYFGCVAVFQWTLGPVVSANNEAGIVISTLAIASLIQPLHRRIKGLIDRRFYRRRYDAAGALSRFTDQLRNEVDLDHIGDDLEVVVRETMQPVHVSLWLRQPGRKT